MTDGDLSASASSDFMALYKWFYLLTYLLTYRVRMCACNVYLDCHRLEWSALLHCAALREPSWAIHVLGRWFHSVWRHTNLLKSRQSRKPCHIEGWAIRLLNSGSRWRLCVLFYYLPSFHPSTCQCLIYFRLKTALDFGTDGALAIDRVSVAVTITRLVTCRTSDQSGCQISPMCRTTNFDIRRYCPPVGGGRMYPQPSNDTTCRSFYCNTSDRGDSVCVWIICACQDVLSTISCLD